MSLYLIEKDKVIFDQNDNGNFFYIIKEGEVAIFINDIFIKTLSDGESFGELSLLHNSPRSATIKTNTEVKVWCMERKNFRKIVDHINYINHLETEKYIASIPFLGNLL